jgi:hypothetical protein
VAQPDFVTRLRNEHVNREIANRGIGESRIAASRRSGENVDMAAHEHRHARTFREGSGRVSESAHLVPSSAMRKLENYSRSRALATFLSPDLHRKFDTHLMDWARKKVDSNVHEVTVAEFHTALCDAANSVPELRGRTADTMRHMFDAEFYDRSGLPPDTKLRVPYSPR